MKLSLSYKDKKKDIGFFLKVNFNSCIGYAEYTPHLHLGYPSSDEVINELTQRRHFLIQNAWYDAFVFNRLDVSIPFKNHSLFYKDRLYKFSKILKIKVTGDLNKDREILKSHLPLFQRYRIDFNSKYSNIDEIYSLLSSVPKRMIDYIEDPVPYSEKIYLEINKSYRVLNDHTHSLAKTASYKSDIDFLYRPNLTPTIKIHQESIFSNQFDGVLGSFHSYCHYLLKGNYKQTHGLFNPLTPKLYLSKGELITINKGKVARSYRELGLRSWKVI